MSNQAVKNAEARRAKKEQAEATAKAMANRDALLRKPAAGSDAAVAAANAAQEEAARKRSEVPASTKIRKQQARKAQQEAVEKRANQDALLKPSAVVIPEIPVGENPPLHVLNEIARQASVDVRDEATEIAKQVGRVTKDLIVGRSAHRGRGGRHQRMAEADERMRRAQAANKPQE